MTAPPVITLLTDFGPGSVYVGQMHAVLCTRAPDVRVVDVAHDCPAQSVAAAAYLLEGSWHRFPRGSVHVAVVDPGVGSARKALAARAHGHHFVAPDNGLLGGVLGADPDAEVFSVEKAALLADEVAPTFHGRDVFAPVAAFLAQGGALTEVGPATEAEVARPGPEVRDGAIAGSVLLEDGFGNLITNIPRALLRDLGTTEIRVHAGALVIAGPARTFSDVARGEPLIYVGSGDHLEIAVNGGRAGDVLGLSVGAAVRIEREGEGR